jgi:hypothetical protein
VTGILKQNATVGDKTLSADPVSQSNALKFFLTNPAADLESVSLAPDSTADSGLTEPPAGTSNWSGSGSFRMFTSGTATVIGRGRTASGAVAAPASANTFKIDIDGSKVKLTVMHPDVTMYFDGTISETN